VSIVVRPVVRAVTQERIGAYADASGDHNPIHVDQEFARSTPFGGTIAHGMLVLALIGEMMRGAYGDAWSTSGKLRVRFKAPPRPGDTVTASAILTKESTDGMEYTVRCASESGEVLIEGPASVRAAG
jgi:3-hydroxybutyryl-CoA dehydratase